MLKTCRTPSPTGPYNNKVCLKSWKYHDCMDLACLKPAAIQFTLEHSQKFTSGLDVFFMLFSCIYIHENS